jgi:hypothetical protein
MKKSTQPSSFDSESSDDLTQFRNLAEGFCQDLAQNGISMRPYEHADLKLFAALSADHRRTIISGLQLDQSIRMEMSAEKESLLATKRYLWRTLGRFGLVPRADLLDRIEDEDVVEVYTPEFYQIFRNLQCFKFCSCTFEELVSTPAWDLLKMPASTIEFVSEVLEKFKAGLITETFAPGRPMYRCHELIGSALFEFDVQTRFVSPAFRDGVPAAFVVVNRGTLITRRRGK